MGWKIDTDLNFAHMPGSRIQGEKPSPDHQQVLPLGRVARVGREKTKTLGITGVGFVSWAVTTRPWITGIPEHGLEVWHVPVVCCAPLVYVGIIPTNSRTLHASHFFVNKKWEEFPHCAIQYPYGRARDHHPETRSSCR